MSTTLFFSFLAIMLIWGIILYDNLRKKKRLTTKCPSCQLAQRANTNSSHTCKGCGLEFSIDNSGKSNKRSLTSIVVLLIVSSVLLSAIVINFLYGYITIFLPKAIFLILFTFLLVVKESYSLYRYFENKNA